MNFDRQVIKPPDKGSFPLDHFHECNDEAVHYSKCVSKHQLMPKRCRKFQIEYLDCRMKNNLMESESMERLGFIDENSWESEEQEKKMTFSRIQDFKEKAWKRQAPHVPHPDNA